MSMEQLPLGISFPDDFNFENYRPGNNAQVINALICACDLNERFLFLSGLRGSGRTHLLQAACQLASQKNRSVFYLPLSEYTQYAPNILSGLQHIDFICLDDIDHIANLQEWEEAIFHFYNLLWQKPQTLVVSANTRPARIPFGLKDLGSRLSSGLSLHVMPVTDEDKIDILQTRAKDRGLILSEGVSNYLLTHCDRNLKTLFDVLDKLDYNSLAQHRRLTIPFVKEVLETKGVK